MYNDQEGFAGGGGLGLCPIFPVSGVYFGRAPQIRFAGFLRTTLNGTADQRPVVGPMIRPGYFAWVWSGSRPINAIAEFRGDDYLSHPLILAGCHNSSREAAVAVDTSLFRVEPGRQRSVAALARAVAARRFASRLLENLYTGPYGAFRDLPALGNDVSRIEYAPATTYPAGSNKKQTA